LIFPRIETPAILAPRAGAAQAVHEVRHLLAERGGARRLPVGAREHCEICVLVGQGAHAGDNLVELGQHYRFARIAQHQRIRKVVDILRRAGEMDELERPLDLPVARQPGLEPVLDRLDVVVGLGLDVLDVPGVAFRKARDELVHRSDGLCAEWPQLFNRGLGGQRLQPFELDLQAVADQRRFAEMVAQRVDALRVTPVQRGKGIQLR
jgi:hypothetical protein